MATTIQIDGDQITLNDAASEETLKELVDLLKRQSGTSGGQSGSIQARQAKQTADNMAKGAKAIKDASVKLGDVVETFDDIETKTGKTFTDIGAKIGKELSTIAKNTGSVINDLVRGPASFDTLGRAIQAGSAQAGELMEEFAQGAAGAVPGIGALGTAAKTGAAVFGAGAMAAAAYAQNLSDGFVALSQSGANFNSDIAKTSAAIAGIGLNLNSFTQIVQQNAQGFAVFGGTVSNGSRKFTELMEVMRGEFGGELAAIGLRFEEQAESMAKFIGMQDRNVAFGTLSYMEQSQAYRGYIKDLNRLATLTGKSREQLQSEIKATELRADANIKLQGATLEAQKAMAFVFDKTSPDSAIAQILMAGIAGKDLAFEAATGNQTIKDMLAGAPEVAEKVRLLGVQIGNGTIDQQTLQEELAKLWPQVQTLGQEFAPLYGANGVATTVTNAASDFQKLGTQAANMVEPDGGLGKLNKSGETTATGLGGVVVAMESSMKEVANTIKQELQTSITSWAEGQGLNEINIGESIQSVITNLDLIAQEFRLFASAPLDYIMGGLETGDLVSRIYDKHGGKSKLAEGLNMKRSDLDRTLRSMSHDDLKKIIFADQDTGLNQLQSILGTTAAGNLDSAAVKDESGTVDVYTPTYNSLEDLKNYLTRNHPNPYASGFDAGNYAMAIGNELSALQSTSPDKVEGYYDRLRALVQGALGNEALAELDPMSDPNLYIKSTFKNAFNNMANMKSLPGLQYGGGVGMNMPYIVGERGPEIFTPSTAGTITPSNELATASGTTSIAAKLDALNATMRLVATNTNSTAQVEAMNNQISTLRSLLGEAKKSYRVSRDLRDSNYS